MDNGMECQDTRADLREYFRIAQMFNDRPAGRPSGSKRWDAMRAGKPGAGRFVHVSKHATTKDGKAIFSYGKTYNVGRNAAKRARRAAA